MTTKQKVTAKAKRLGCKIEVMYSDIILTAPDGLLLKSGMESSVWNMRDYSKATIWADFWDEMGGIDSRENQQKQFAERSNWIG